MHMRQSQNSVRGGVERTPTAARSFARACEFGSNPDSVYARLCAGADKHVRAQARARGAVPKGAARAGRGRDRRERREESMATRGLGARRISESQLETN